MSDPLDLIPPRRRDAARDALTAAFGPTPVEELILLKGGVSGAAVCRIEIGGRTCLLRLEPERVPLNDRKRHYFCMTAGARAGVAPPIHYADAATGVAVMDFVEARPLAEHPGGPAGVARELGGLIARVQTARRFPSPADDVLATLLKGLCATGLFAPGVLDAHAEGLARLRAARPWDPPTFVASHNDPNPRNLLFDGQRLWLVDWELGFRHDPLFDLAIVTLDLADTPELEDALLTGALGAPPDRRLRAELAVVRQLVLLFYGCIVMDSLKAMPRAEPLTSLGGLTPKGFRTAVAEGRLPSGSAETAWAFGLMSLRAFLDGLAAPGFEETLEIATGG